MRRCNFFYECDRKIPVTNKCKCRYFESVELDPYWKDIIDETNRRLNLKK